MARVCERILLREVEVADLVRRGRQIDQLYAALSAMTGLVAARWLKQESHQPYRIPSIRW
jgi:homoserine kinase